MNITGIVDACELVFPVAELTFLLPLLRNSRYVASKDGGRDGDDIAAIGAFTKAVDASSMTLTMVGGVQAGFGACKDPR